jgi:hypothetical protein
MRRELANLGAVELGLALTLADLVLQPVGNWLIRPLVLLLAVSALLMRGLLRSPILWASLFALSLLRVLLDWPLSDNHAYLLAWWCLACALCLCSEQPERALASSARLLIGLSFGLAVFWKTALSPDFMDETFFRVTLLLDPRFEGLAELGGGLTAEQIASAREHLAPHTDGPSPAAVPALVLPPRVLALAGVATWWTITSELVVALSFLWPGTGGLARLRDAALLLFCAATYAFATVEGFGWLLLAMGAAQCDPLRERTRWLYLATFALILSYREVPWADVLRPAIGAG